METSPDTIEKAKENIVRPVRPGEIWSLDVGLFKVVKVTPTKVLLRRLASARP